MRNYYLCELRRQIEKPEKEAVTKIKISNAVAEFKQAKVCIEPKSVMKMLRRILPNEDLTNNSSNKRSWIEELN